MSRHPLLACLPALLAGGLVLQACGKRGDPLPPRRLTPQTITELELAQRGANLEIRIQAPRATTEGERLGVVTLEILRAEGDAALGRSGARRQEKAAPGERLVLTEPLPPAGTLVRIAAIATSNKRSSAQSALRQLKIAEPVPPPEAFGAELDADGVRLRFRAPEPMPAWIEAPKPAAVEKGARTGPGRALSTGPRTADPGVLPATTEAAGLAGATDETTSEPASDASPAPAASPEPPRASGFHVYRRIQTGRYSAPLNPQPLTEAAYLDATAPLQAEVCYEVRTVVSEKPLIESEATPEACLRVLDKKAPDPPTGVATLPVADGIEVSWSPSSEPDLAGYRVYRHVRGGPVVLLLELGPGDTSAIDGGATAGLRVLYHVTALDRAGNESAASASVEGVRR